MTEPYPSWTSDIRSPLVRRIVESYLDINPMARDLTPASILAKAGLTIVGRPMQDHPESFIAQVTAAGSDVALINAEKILREITLLSEHSAPALSA